MVGIFFFLGELSEIGVRILLIGDDFVLDELLFIRRNELLRCGVLEFFFCFFEGRIGVSSRLADRKSDRELFNVGFGHEGVSEKNPKEEDNYEIKKNDGGSHCLLEFCCFSGVENKNLVEDSESIGLFEEALFGFVRFFVPKGEGGVVHGDELFGTEVEIGLKSFFGIEVDVTSTRSFVGSNGKEGDVDIEAFPNFLKPVEVGAVPSVVNVAGRSFHEEASIISMSIVTEASAPVMRWGVNDFEIGEGLLFPDRHLGDVVEAQFSHERA